ncbi:hypothetical protein AURDEDRAFT_177722, partial [Auricularia subglabra TFB-10046 SS5]
MPARPRTPEDEEGLIIPWSPSPSPSPDRTPAKLEKKGRRPRESVESSVTLLADQSYLKPQSGPAPPVAHTSSTEGDEKRLKLIEEALDEPAPPSRPARGTKRASDTSLHDGNVQLPHAPLVGEPKPKKSRRTNPFAQQQQGSPPVPAALPVPRPTRARPRTPEDEEELIIPWPPSPDRTPARLEKKGRRPRESVESSVTLLANQSYLKPQSGPVPP